MLRDIASPSIFEEPIPMRTVTIAGIAAGVLAAFFGTGEIGRAQIKPAAKETSKLWSAVSMSHSVFDPFTFNVSGPEIHLGLVNDGTQTVETGLRDSVLIVNGKSLSGEKWEAALKECLTGDAWERLRPNEHTVVVCPLQGLVDQPGTYRLSWKGKQFQSPETVLRILPRDPVPSKEPGIKLWAAVRVVPPVVVMDRPGVSRHMLFLELVNDGKDTVETGVADSVLFLNDLRFRGGDWRDAILGGPGSDDWTRLRPGETTGKGIGSWPSFFPEAGIFRVSWRGKNFQSPEITYRVLPPKVK
jgi:hypothetical protein